MTSHKTPAADRSHGGPGSSQQDRTKPRSDERKSAVAPGQPTNGPRSRISGGGGERDSHHTHNPATKS